LEAGVIDPKWNVVDDPRRGRSPATLDDEGRSTRATPLLREGGVVSCLHDAVSARRQGSGGGGHGRVATYRDPVLPRMTCTFQTAAHESPMALVERVGDGVYVRRMESAYTDTRAGRAVFRVTDADRIVRGRCTRALAPFLLEILGRDLLAKPAHIGDDLAFDTCVGSCHKEGQPLVVSVGAPTIWTGVTRVRGSNGNERGWK
jgi:predicted Zn-dependent protease